MKFNNKEQWLILLALRQTSAWFRSCDRPKEAKQYNKLADKIEKELLK